MSDFEREARRFLGIPGDAKLDDEQARRVRQIVWTLKRSVDATRRDGTGMAPLDMRAVLRRVMRRRR